MNTKTLAYILIAVVVVAAGGYYIYSRASQSQTKESTDNMKDDNYMSSAGENPLLNQDSQNANASNLEPVQTTPSADGAMMAEGSGGAGDNTMTETTTNKTGNCSAPVDKSVWKTEIDPVGKIVTLKVKGFGDIEIAFYDKDAPKTVQNFLRLVQSGYFDCLTFHRVAKGFVIQGGDPKGNGSGGESIYGAKFADELDKTTPSYKAGYVRGVVAMANSGPNTNGSQFFIMLDDLELPHNYTIFGKVSKGLDTVDKVAAVEITPQMGPNDGAPKTPVIIEKATINSLKSN